MMIKFIIFVFVCFVFRIARENAASNQYVFFIVNLPSKRDLTLSVIVTIRLKTLDCAFGRTKSQKCKQIRHLVSLGIKSFLTFQQSNPDYHLVSSCYGLTTSNAMNSDNDSTCVLFSVRSHNMADLFTILIFFFHVRFCL